MQDTSAEFSKSCSDLKQWNGFEQLHRTIVTTLSTELVVIIGKLVDDT